MSKINWPILSFDRISFCIYLSTIFLLPFFYLPGTEFSLAFAKSALFAIGIILSFVLWLVARLIEGKINIPKSPILLSGLGLVTVYALSSFFSPAKSISFFGYGFEVSTWANITLLFLAMFLASVFCHKKQNALWLFSAILASFIISALLSIILFVDPLGGALVKYLPFSVVGSLNDLSILSGVALILTVLALQFLSVSKVAHVVFWIISVFSLFIMATVGYLAPWIIACIIIFILFVYGLSLRQYGARQNFPTSTFIILAISIVFILTFNIFGAKIPSYFNITNQEIRPTVLATYLVTKSTIKENPILGTGPNRWGGVWQLYKPETVNLTDYWNTNFNTGFGFIPSQVAVTGILGGLAWLIFIALFIYTSCRRLIVHAFIGLYLIIFALIYAPSLPILALLFVLVGILIGDHSAFKKKYLYPARFFGILILVVLICATLLFGYVFSKKFIGATYFLQAIRSENNPVGIVQAEEKLLKAIRLDANDLYFRSLAQLYLTQIDLFQSGLDQAVQSARLAVAYDPANYLNWLAIAVVSEKGFGLNAEGAYESARDAYLNALRLNPKNPEIYLALARLEIARDNKDGASQYLNQSIALKSNYVEAINMLKFLNGKTDN